MSSSRASAERKVQPERTMHELTLTQEIVNAVLKRAAGARVTGVRLEIGKLSGVVADSVRFCFDLCVAGTAAEGAVLAILEPPGRARCRACGREAAFEQPYGPCFCGGIDLDWLSGFELIVRDMEVIPCAPPAAAPTGPSRA